MKLAAEGVLKMSPRAITATHDADLSKAAFKKLMADIEKNGIREPLKVVRRPSGTYVVNGNNRLRAALYLGLDEVPVESVELPFGQFKTDADLYQYLRH